jgi:hypothetical protein
MLIAGQPERRDPMSEEQGRRLLSTEVRSLETDDTVEIALTAEDTLALSQAAEERQPVAILGKSMSAARTYLRQQYLRRDRRPLVLPASLLGMAIGVALGVAADRIYTVRTETPPGATAPAESREPPVRFRNPFDASEVFEFPPGTSDDSARESVAAMLLQRARDRHVTQERKKGRAFDNPASLRARLDAHGLLSQDPD